MKINEILLEVPVKDIHAIDLSADPHTDYMQRHRDAVSSFPDRRDWAQVSKSGLIKKNINALSRSPIDMDWYFYRLPNEKEAFATIEEQELAGILDTSKLDYIKYYFKIKIPRKKPERVIVLFLQHEQAENLLTPWMMIHRIAHAFIIEIRSIVDKAKRKYDFIYSDIDQFMTTKSARENTFSSFNEKYIELFTQFLYIGKIILQLNDDDPYPEINIEDKIMKLQSMENHINNEFLQLVNSWLGKRILAF